MKFKMGIPAWMPSSLVDRKTRFRTKQRTQSGNMLVFISCGALLTALIGLLALGLVRLLGTNHEQRSAAEAAALAATVDLSKIVILTPQFGYVGLSDSAPNGAYTDDPNNGDGYAMPVHGINTLLATTRLDMMIASVIPNVQNNGTQNSDPLLTQLAQNDLNDVYAVQGQLQQAFTDACLASPQNKYYDAQGNQVNVYQDAVKAYQTNGVRMSGQSAYVNNSLKLSLGYVASGITTDTPVPQGLTGTLQPLSSSQQANNCYNAYVDCPFAGQDFYFAAICNAVKLVDTKSWLATLPNLPNGLPQPPLACVVKAEADQQLAGDNSQFNGGTIHAVACAVPASAVDPKPYPGSLQVAFPDGPLADFNCIQDMLSNKDLNDHPDKVTCYTSTGGDYPNGGNLSSNNSLWPFGKNSPDNGKNGACIADYMKLGLYDWIRRGGTKVNISSVVNMLTQPFNANGPDINWNVPLTPGGASTFVCKIAQGIVHIYTFNPDGMITYTSQSDKPQPYQVVSQNQLFAEAIDGKGGFFQSQKPQGLQGNGPATASYNQIQVHGLQIPDPNAKDGKPISGDVQIQNKYDIYVRDNSRILSPGPNAGGRHGGEPSDLSAIVLAPPDLGQHGGGKGDPPLVAIVSDFAEGYSNNTNFLGYSTGPGGAAVRPSYQQSGNVTEIRFRRDIQIGGPLSSLLGYEEGYFSEEDPPY